MACIVYVELILNCWREMKVRWGASVVTYESLKTVLETVSLPHSSGVPLERGSRQAERNIKAGTQIIILGVMVYNGKLCICGDESTLSIAQSLGFWLGHGMRTRLPPAESSRAIAGWEAKGIRGKESGGERVFSRTLG